MGRSFAGVELGWAETVRVLLCSKQEQIYPPAVKTIGLPGKGICFKRMFIVYITIR
jgi:hypothetical protein